MNGLVDCWMAGWLRDGRETTKDGRHEWLCGWTGAAVREAFWLGLELNISVGAKAL